MLEMAGDTVGCAVEEGLRIEGDAALGGKLFEGGFVKLNIADGNKAHERPISNQQPNADGHHRARFAETENQPGKEIANRDAIQHPHEPQAGPGTDRLPPE